MMIPIKSSRKLETIFLDIYGPLPKSEGRHPYKFILMVLDHYTKYTKLYPIIKATTKTALDNIFNSYIPELGTPTSIITDHGTQFKGKKWKETLIEAGIKTYKISVYQATSNPAV